MQRTVLEGSLDCNARYFAAPGLIGIGALCSISTSSQKESTCMAEAEVVELQAELGGLAVKDKNVMRTIRMWPQCSLSHDLLLGMV